MSSVVVGQCNAAMLAKLKKKSDLLFLLEAAQVACVGVQDNFSIHIVPLDELYSFASFFQKSGDDSLNCKKTFLVSLKRLDKADFSFCFGKRFLASKKKHNPSLVDDEASTKAAKNKVWYNMGLKLQQTILCSITVQEMTNFQSLLQTHTVLLQLSINELMAKDAAPPHL